MADSSGYDRTMATKKSKPVKKLKAIPTEGLEAIRHELDHPELYTRTRLKGQLTEGAPTPQEAATLTALADALSIIMINAREAGRAQQSKTILDAAEAVWSLGAQIRFMATDSDSVNIQGVALTRAQVAARLGESADKLYQHKSFAFLVASWLTQRDADGLMLPRPMTKVGDVADPIVAAFRNYREHVHHLQCIDEAWLRNRLAQRSALPLALDDLEARKLAHRLFKRANPKALGIPTADARNLFVTTAKNS